MADNTKDTNVGSDSLLTKELATGDRVMFTRAATGQQIATMTVGEFMARCAAMMPPATAGANGAMTAADRGFIPDGYGVRQHRISLTMTGSGFIRLRFAGKDHQLNAVVTVTSGYYYHNITGMVSRGIAAMNGVTFNSSVIGYVGYATAPLYYLSGVMKDPDNENGVMVYLGQRRDNLQRYQVFITVYAGQFLGWESMEDPGHDWTKSNYEEWRDHTLTR